MKTVLRRLSKLSLLAGLILVLSALIARADGTGQPSLRFVQAMPGVASADFYLDDQRLLSNIGYGRASDYFTTTPGERNARLLEVGTNNQIVDRRLNYETGRVYTMLAMGRRDNPGERELIRFDNDTNQPPNKERAALRFVHASPGAPNVNVCLAGTEDCRVVNLAFKQASGYIELDPNVYSFEVRLADGQRMPVPNVRLNQGLTYMLVAIGLPGGNPGIEVITLIESGGPPQTPPTGAFLTPIMAGLILIVLALLGGSGWLVWRQIGKFRAR